MARVKGVQFAITLMTSEATKKLDKQKGETLQMIKRNDPGNCNGGQEADRFY